jgi:hypothetical protein
MHDVEEWEWFVENEPDANNGRQYSVLELSE